MEGDKLVDFRGIVYNTQRS